MEKQFYTQNSMALKDHKQTHAQTKKTYCYPVQYKINLYPEKTS